MPRWKRSGRRSLSWRTQSRGAWEEEEEEGEEEEEEDGRERDRKRETETERQRETERKSDGFFAPCRQHRELKKKRARENTHPLQQHQTFNDTADK